MSATAASRCGLALRYHQAGETKRAEALYRAAIKADPGLARAHELLGLLALQTGRPELARDSLTRAVTLDPACASAHNRLGVALAATDSPDGAIAAYRTALTLDPGCAEAHSNLGAALAAAGGLDAAMACYRRALDADPALIEARNGLAVAQLETGDLDGAIAGFDAVLEAAPEDATAHKNRGLALLRAGRFGAGFDEWEWRRRVPEAPERVPVAPPWRGELLAGKTILIRGEQGVGDQIMLGTVVGEIVEEAAAMVLEVEPRLVPLFARAWPDATVVAETDPPDPAVIAAAVDVEIALGSLCRWRRRRRADFEPHAYLAPDPARARLGPQTEPRVGIAWHSHLHGSPQAARFGRAKSCPLMLWQPILTTPAVRFVSVQYGDVAEDVAAAASRFGVEIEVDPAVDQLVDLEGFAAQLGTLDLVITVSTTAAHLAGALGIPTWVLLPHVADWRWQATGETCLWYPNTRLFRQPGPGDWPAVVADVATALTDRFDTAQPAIMAR